MFENVKRKTDIVDVFAKLFLFFCIFLPVTYSFIRLCLLLLFFVFSLFISIKSEMRFNISGFIILFFSLLYNVLSTVNGVINNTPGATRCLTVDFFWPIMLSFSLSIWVERNDLTKIIRFLMICSSFTIMWDLWYCFSKIGLIPFPHSLLSINLEYSFNHEGILFQYITNHMVSYMFITPVTFALLLCGNSDKYIGKIFMKFLFVMELLLLYFSGRVAFVLSSFFAILITIILKRICSKNLFIHMTKSGMKRGVILLIVFPLLLLFGAHISKKVFGHGIEGIQSYVTWKLSGTIKGDTNSQETNLRYVQSKYLLEGWRESPLIGHGTGSYTTKIIRSSEQPWAYESAYVAMLFQKGVLGLILYFSPCIWIIFTLCKKVRRKEYSIQEAVPICVGLICMLMVNSVDPYLNTMGSQWMIYLPYSFAMKHNQKNARINNENTISQKNLMPLLEKV